MQQVVLAVIMNNGRVVVEQLVDEIRSEFRGVPAVLPGGHIHEGETPEAATKRKVYTDIGIAIKIESTIASREHPLFPGSSFTYYFCTVIGSPDLKINNQKKAKTAQWVDVNTAAILMLTLYSKVLSFLIQQVYGSTLPQGTTLPELAWLKQDFENYGRKIREGELVAFPTETVYGLGANAFNETAIAKIFQAKNRPADNPLIVHVSSIDALEKVVSSIDNLSEKVMKHFTPGPLTVLLPKNAAIPSLVTAGSSLVGVRIPAHLIALEFLVAAQVPVAAPSANKSGKPSATNHKHVIAAFGAEVPNVLSAGDTYFGVESTVVMPKNNEELVIMRQGAITKEQLEQAFPAYGVVIASKEDAKNAPSPGVKYRHYAPNAKIHLVAPATKQKMLAEIEQLYAVESKTEDSVVVCSEELKKSLPPSVRTIVLGSEKKMEDIAKNLYSALLECDAQRVDVIIMQTFPEKGAGRTVMERIRRAAEK